MDLLDRRMDPLPRGSSMLGDARGLRWIHLCTRGCWSIRGACPSSIEGNWERTDASQEPPQPLPRWTGTSSDGQGTTRTAHGRCPMVACSYPWSARTKGVSRNVASAILHTLRSGKVTIASRVSLSLPPEPEGGVGLRTRLNESLAHGGEVVLRDRGRMHPDVQPSQLACSNGILQRDRGMPSGLPTPCCGGEGGPRYRDGHGQVQGRAKDCEHDGGSRSFVHAVGRDRFTSVLASSLASCVHRHTYLASTRRHFHAWILSPLAGGLGRRSTCGSHSSVGIDRAYVAFSLAAVDAAREGEG